VNWARTVEQARKNPIRVGVAIAALVAAFAILVLLLTAGGDSSDRASDGAEIVSVNGLREVSAQKPTPIYWAGERAGTEIELSQSSGRAYVRYLTGGAEAGDPRATFLTVGTYEQPDSVAALRSRGHEPGGVLAKAPGGGTIYFDRDQPHSVYLAYPGVRAEIEVYDPDFKTALKLVDAGQVVPVG